MDRALVMGIVNVTPDSFSDGGLYYAPDQAVRRARNMADEGADIVDLGGESTRPGATPVGWEQEWSRLEPVLAELAGAWSDGRGPAISVDTYHPETAARACAAGAAIVNCVRAESAAEMLGLCAKNGAGLVLPVRLEDGVPKVAAAPLGEIVGAAGFPHGRLWLDPMVGFGTTREEDVALLRSVPELARHGRVLVGASRKRIVHKLTGAKGTGKLLGGSVGLAVWCALRGAAAVRVHDVAETVQALAAVAALGRPDDAP